jgi:TP901 family phage tail tape measure protein
MPQDRVVKAVLKADTSGFVAGMKSAQRATQDFAADAQKSAGKNKAAWESTGKGMMATGAVLAAGVGLAVKSFADFDAAMSEAQAGTMATGASLDSLREAAIDAGAKTSFSATEAAQAITAMGKAGVSTKDILGGGLKGALDLAAAGQLDVAQASEIAATAMNQFGLEGKDIPHVADLLAAGAGKAMGSVQDLAGAMKYVGPTAKGLGISIEQTTGSLAMFAQQGLLGEQAGTSLRSVLLTLTSPSGVVAKKMEELGINAYDANGKFIGLEGAAGVLRDKLGPLDDATRNAALGQIFGNEAVGAARILYEGGAGAVEKWTASVDDAGFASRQAAMLTDNLKGDVERLGGSLSSVLIKSGSGANGMLRLMTQELQGAVDLYGSAPVPIQQGATALGAVAAAALLAGGSLLVLAPRIAATKLALADMGRTGQLISRGLSGVGSALKGPLGVGLAVGVVALGYFAKQAQESKARVDELSASLDQQTGALTESTRAVVAKGLADSGALQDAKEFGVSVADVTSAVLGVPGAMDRVNASLVEYRSGLTDANAADMIESTYKFANSLGISNSEVDKAVAAQKLLAEANDAGADSTDAAAAAQAGAAPKAQALAQSEEDLKAAADEAKKAHDALTDSITNFGSAMMTARGDARSYEAAIDAAQAAVAKNGRTLDITTEKGRDNADALDGIATSALKAAQSSMENAEANGTLASSSMRVAGDVQKARQAFIDAAVSMGMNRGEAEKLATQAGLTAARVQGIKKELIDLGKQAPKPTVNVITAAAQAKVTAIQARINAIRQSRVPGVDANTEAGREKIRALQEQINLLRGKTISITTMVNRVASGPGGPGGLTPASGGYIQGPGTGTSDSIPAMLSNGEFVINARATERIGLAELARLNSYASGGLVRGARFASGGFVAADWSAMSGGIPTNTPTGADIADLRLRQAKATTALHTAEVALNNLRHTKGHIASQVSLAEQRITNARGSLRSVTTSLQGAETARAAAAKPYSTKFHVAATKSNAATSAFLRNIDTLNKRGFHTLADQLVMAADDEAYTLAAQAVKSSAVAKTLTADVKRSVDLENGLTARQDKITARLSGVVPADPLAGMRFFSATPTNAPAQAAAGGSPVDMSGVRSDLATQTGEIRKLVAGIGGELDRQARTIQTMQRQMT